MAQLQGRDINKLAVKRLMQTIIEDVIFDDGFYGELKDDSHFKDVCRSVLKKRLEAG